MQCNAVPFKFILNFHIIKTNKFNIYREQGIVHAKTRVYNDSLIHLSASLGIEGHLALDRNREPG